MNFKENKNLAIIALIAIVNALGYGIIIPILYSYSMKFGLNDFENGLLFAVFSLFQFISTPIIGRLSDKYGRRPLLIGSLAGTAGSFFLMAIAPNAIFLFLARALDGLTAGNIPVASAVISDTTDEKNRAKGFGIIGASFGFGMLVGPAISAFTVSINTAIPFLIAGVISLIAVALTYLLLPETNKHMGEVYKGKLFDFGKLYHALFDPNVGITFLITLFFSMAFSLFIYAFQPFSVKALHLSANQISLLYTLFGVIGLIAQVFLVQRISQKFGIKRAFRTAIFLVSLAFLGMFLATNLPFFIAVSILLGLSNSIVQPLISTVLSNETDAKSQGSVLGLNASYMSIGQIFGPIIGGAIATIAVQYPFLAASAFALLCFGLSFHVLKPGIKKESAF